MTISAFAAGSFATQRSTETLIALKGRLDALTNQLVTGRTAQTYGGLGAGRVTSLDARGAISQFDGYVAAASNAKTRIDVATLSLTNIKTVADRTRTQLLSNLQTTSAAGVASSTAQARSSFDAAIDALSQQVAGNYIFSGRATGTEPVISSAVIFEGDVGAGLVGLKRLVAEQRRADLGKDGTGRLSTVRNGATVSLGEDPSVQARANFGFRILNASSSNPSGIAVAFDRVADQGGEPSFASVPAQGDTIRVGVLRADGRQTVIDLSADAASTSEASFAPGSSPSEAAANLKASLQRLFGPDAKIASIQSGDPPGVSLTFPSNNPGSTLGFDVSAPTIGDTVSLTLGMRDGTTTVITLTASADGAADGAFKIDTSGTTPAERATNTAASLEQALTRAIGARAQTDLSASSMQRAADDFFDGAATPGLAPRRVEGDGYAVTARTDTVIWYRGEVSPSDPRNAATVQVGAGQSIGIGARANEAPIRSTLAGLAALAIGDTATTSSDQGIARFAATAARTVDKLTPATGKTTIADVITTFGLAASNTEAAKVQAQSSKAVMQDAIDGVEAISVEEVATKLLSLQTQIQASYQVTAMMSKLTLANYIG